MKIKKEVLELIRINTAEISYEIGGILGADSNGVITDIVLDIPKKIKHPCSYYPNVEELNRAINSWQQSNIKFSGIFHTHFANVDTLSVGDKKYIEAIMKNMPDNISSLYFPIYTLPNNAIKIYSAYLENGALKIEIKKAEII